MHNIFFVQIGGGSFQPNSILSATKQAVAVGVDVNIKLIQKLKQENGFVLIFFLSFYVLFLTFL